MRAGDRVPTASVRRSFKPNPAETCVDAQMTAPSGRILRAQSDLGSGQKISAVPDTETRLDSRASTLGSSTMWLDELDLSGMRQDFRKVDSLYLYQSGTPMLGSRSPRRKPPLEPMSC